MSASISETEAEAVLAEALREELREWVVEQVGEDSGVLLADGFEDAFIGLGQQFNKVVAIYDQQVCIEILMDRDGMSEVEAGEFFDFNVVGAFVGPQTPIFLGACWADTESDDADDGDES